MNHWTRRGFLQATAAALVSAPAGALVRRREFEISVAGWSLHREVGSGRKTQLELFQFVRDEFDIRAFELVNSMLEIPSVAYVDRLSQAAGRAGVVIPLIMIDQEGSLGAASPEERQRAVRYHDKWVEVAADLGCHAIRVNWNGFEGDVLENPSRAAAFIDRSVGAFGHLVEPAQKRGIRVLIENHGGGPSTRPEMLARLIQRVGPGLGTLPDFGNFPEGADRYQAIDGMMPFAGAVSAKCHDFGPSGQETATDFERMLSIVVDKHGYHGFIGIEYEGERLSEPDGIRSCLDLLQRLRGDVLPEGGLAG